MVLSIVLCFFVFVSTASAPPPPSWNDGVAKTAIVTFVRAVTDKKGKDDVAPVAEHLHLDMACALDQLFEIEPAIAKGGHC